MKKVVVLGIKEYSLEIIKERVKEVIFKHFPLHKFLLPHEKIILKPNLLMESGPEEAITTHPIFIEAIGSIFKEIGYPVSIADTTGGFADSKSMETIYSATGIKEAAARQGLELLFPNKTIIYEHIPFCWWVEGFKMINLPKLKTHDIMILTLEVKNLYGCINGLHKSHLHKVYTKAESLANFLLELPALIKPSLNIVVGILALEGNGPARSGRPKKLNMVVIGDYPLYVDYAIAKLLGLKDDINPLIKVAKEKRILLEEELELISEITAKEVEGFRFPAPFILNSMPTPLIFFFKLLFKFKPQVNKNKCTGCRICEEVCPVKAISLKEQKAVIDYKICILCMCCAEMCRAGAVDLDRGSILKIIDYIRR